MRILWDEPKRLANLETHGLDFADLTPDFFAAAYVGSARRARLRALGRVNGRPVVVIFAALGTEGCSVISMRTANPQERALIR